MSDIKPTVPEAIDHLESFVAGMSYVANQDTKCAILIVLAELNRAAGEIVVLREQVKEAVNKARRCNTCSYPLQPAETVCPCCGDSAPEYQVTQ